MAVKNKPFTRTEIPSQVYYTPTGGYEILRGISARDEYLNFNLEPRYQYVGSLGTFYPKHRGLAGLTEIGFWLASKGVKVDKTFGKKVRDFDDIPNLYVGRYRIQIRNPVRPRWLAIGPRTDKRSFERISFRFRDTYGSFNNTAREAVDMSDYLGYIKDALKELG